MALLTRLLARREFPLPHFDLQPLRFELTTAEAVDAAVDENVVRADRAVPTAGQLRECIERHLQATRAGPQPASTPVEELRDALAELRHSLR